MRRLPYVIYGISDKNVKEKKLLAQIAEKI